MANYLTITKSFDSGQWLVEAIVDDTNSEVDFPRNIFLWTVDLDGSLLDWQVVGHLDEIAKYPDYSTDWTSNFGKRLCKYTDAKKWVSTEALADDVITVMKSAFDLLLIEYNLEAPEVVETYPALPETPAR